MSQIIPLNKNHPLNGADRRIFLRAMYGNAPRDLYMELRCIHPTTGEVKTLWGHMGHKRQLAERLKFVEKLNREGFGVFFAPCLRGEMKGRAESAEWVPALWIDIDSKATLNQDLEVVKASQLKRLREFSPKPSFIIDSGGGWHGYWLLESPFLLKTDEDRQYIASILNGLFSTLNGDPQYIKSVASVMRLPDTINTKPERGGVVATVLHSQPEKRYPLKAFGWMAIDPNQQHVGGLQVISTRHQPNGQSPLPPRTESYLANGATNGNRNAELFAAACQLRDAGYSQADAERDLIPRHVADGDSRENPAQRESEARATIASAYSRPPREPLTEPRKQARERVSQLIGSYAPQSEQERPSAQEIADAVKDCAHLNAVEWAEERQRLKSICGDGLRLTDLDRLYREARREIQRDRLPADDRYFEEDDAIFYEKVSDRGVSRQRVADWSAEVTERSSRIDDDGEVEHIVKLNLKRAGKELSLNVPSELFGDAYALQRHITRQAGEQFTARTGMSKHLPTALLSLSGDYPTKTTYGFMGWTQINDKWTYVTPTLAIDADGVRADAPEVELESRLRDYGLKQVSWEDSLAAFKAFTRVLPDDIGPGLIAYACLPLVQSFFPTAAPKPAVHLQGTTGSGKSEIAALMCSFYGHFGRDMPPSQWGDTVNTVEALGYSLKDALYWVDDYKDIYADERTFTRLLQSYSRLMGRGRMTREAKLRVERPCRGHILSTGETMLTGEASVKARMIVMMVEPWGKRDPHGKALKLASDKRADLGGFLPYFVQWLAQQADSNQLKTELAEGFVLSTKGYEAKLTGLGINPSSVERLVQGWAVLVTTFRLLFKFMRERDAYEVLPVWCDTLIDGAKSMREDRAGLLFLDGLQQLLASGELTLAENIRDPQEARAGTTIVGYKDGEHIYILPDVAYRAVMRIHPLKFNTSAIGAQLAEDGWLVSGSGGLTVQRRIRGVRTRFWQLRADFIEDQESTVI